MTVDRSKRPLSAEKIEFIVPVIQKFYLQSGLQIYFSEKNELPIVRINFVVNSGSKSDPGRLKGLNNLLAMCIDEGAGNYNALQLADEFEMLGAQFSVSSDNDTIVISLQVLSEYFNDAIKLFASIISEPHLAEMDFRREKNKVLARLQQVKTEPDYLAEISFQYLLLGRDSPYAYPVLGTEQTVPNIHVDSIRDLYKMKFSPLNSSLVVVGSIDAKSLQTALGEAFENWNVKAAIKELPFNPKKSERKVFIINKNDAVQTEIRTGHLTSKRNSSDFFQKQIINLVLGGQFSSRLNLNLREKNGYTYGVNSRFHYLQEAAFFAVSTSVDVENTTNALKEIHSEIIKIREGITTDEINFAKSSLTKRFPSNFETYRQIAGNITSKIIYDLPDDYFETYIDKINLVDADEVNKIAFASYHPEELLTVLVGDSKQILSQIKGEEFGDVVLLEYENLFNPDY